MITTKKIYPGISRHVVKALLVLAIGILCVGSAMAQDIKKLRIGVDGTYPPYSHRNIAGEFSGLDIDIANEVCRILKSKCTFVQFSSDNLVPALRGGKIDLIIAALQATDAIRELISLSTSYLTIPSAIIVRKDSILSGIEIQDLQDAQLGTLNSSSHGEYIRVHFPKTVVKHFDDQSAYFLELVNRQVDGVVGDPVVLNDWLNTPDGANCCRFLGALPHDGQINGEGFAIGVDLKQVKILEAVNRALDSLRKSGTAAKIRRRHLPFLN